MNEKLLSGLITGFIDESLESISTYKPTILSNDYLNNSKVLNEIIYNLKNFANRIIVLFLATTAST